MNAASSPELFYMVLTAGLTAVIWPPYIINRLMEMGIWTAVSTPAPDDPPKSDWAKRLMKAHSNAVENLVVFAPLAVAIHVMDLSTESTALAAAVFFWSRLGHIVVYLFGIPLARTLLFAVGFFCQVVLFLRLVGG